jgi:hypothetical protein
MNPAVACLQALFTALAAGLYMLYVILDVGTTLLRHAILQSNGSLIVR